MKKITLPIKLENIDYDSELLNPLKDWISKYNNQVRNFKAAPPLCEFKREEKIDQIYRLRYRVLALRASVLEYYNEI